MIKTQDENSNNDNRSNTQDMSGNAEDQSNTQDMGSIESEKEECSNDEENEEELNDNNDENGMCIQNLMNIIMCCAIKVTGMFYVIVIKCACGL